MNIQDFLNNRKIPFELLEHAPTYSAQELAESVHVSGHEVAKTVLLQADSEFMLAVLPATRDIDFLRVASFLGAKHVGLADEEECGKHFPDFELGAVPPFGSKYGLRTIAERSLLEDEQIVFEGNSHHEAIRMSCKDYVAVEDPVIADFA